MGIEPTRKALPSLQNKHFGAMADAKCDGRVNFRSIQGYLGPRRDTSASEIPGSGLPLAAEPRNSLLGSGRSRPSSGFDGELYGPQRASRRLAMVRPVHYSIALDAH
jgi:hypothetical protein